MADDWRMDRVGSALRGENPAVLQRLTAGFAVIGDVQFLPGYSVLLVDDPEVERLSDLPRARRLSFLSDMDQLGEAVEQACRRPGGAGLDRQRVPVRAAHRQQAARASYTS